jgi:hypothetical protein
LKYRRLLTFHKNLLKRKITNAVDFLSASAKLFQDKKASYNKRPATTKGQLQQKASYNKRPATTKGQLSLIFFQYCEYTNLKAFIIQTFLDTNDR